MTTPEARARIEIDRLLTEAGWVVQDRDAMNLYASRGVAVREFSLTTGFADYLLFVDRKAIGAIEAKAVGMPLSGVEAQSAKYRDGIPTTLKSWRSPLPFLYESTGVETFFTDGRDPEPRSRRVFAFHQPDTLLQWVKEVASFRTRLRSMPELMTTGLWDAQIRAVRNLEESLAEDRPRALIQMATGSGKTFTAVSFIYRLIKHGGARRVLFLVDRSNLGRQTLREFQQYVTPDDGRKFTEIYNVQQLQSNALDSVSRVCITTIQRLYSMLSGEPELASELEDQSFDELTDVFGKTPKTVQYNPKIPIEYFDVIVTDECHRSIYHLWRQVLEYFDAHLIGLTATPSKQTLGFFNKNLVMEYTRQHAVLDGVNVDGEVYRIRTAITEGGSTVEEANWVTRRDRRTRTERLELLDEEFTYTASQLDREVTAVDQIRTVVRTFREKLFTELFPDRAEVPKTLIFAKDDNHAEEIVRIVREEFGKGNDFCQKITYKVSAKPEELIRALRNEYNPRIAVTVDMIATGTDIKALECLIFLRLVKSPGLFEQMLGRGTRVINPTDLQAVTSDAVRKDRFIIVDAVGVVDHPKAETKTLERKRSVSFEKLINLVASGNDDEDVLSSLAVRLSRLDKTLTDQERYTVRAESGGLDLHELAQTMLDALDPDRQIVAAQAASGREAPSDAEIVEAAEELRAEALRPLAASPQLRKTLIDIHQRDEQTIDTVSQDVVREAGFSVDATEKARATIDSFQAFLAQHRDEITALQILYNQPYRKQRLTFRQIKELAQLIEQPPLSLTTETLWRAYAQLERDKVRGANAKRTLTDLVALIRHAIQLDEELTPYPEQVRRRYERWLERQAAVGKTFTPEQRWWLDTIAEQVGVNLSITLDDFGYGPLASKGGLFGAKRTFGSDWAGLLDELNDTLAA